MTNALISDSEEITDSELVRRSLSGDRNAFGRIVVRYQSVVCSLAYSATGSLSESEDLAQETFLAAWKRLTDLREPEKLGSWLRGIARNLGYRLHRSHLQQPSHGAEEINDIREHAATDPLPSDCAVTAEEEAIMWRALERIPGIYREPLILFYRQHQSVERVAQVLELSEEVVRQRLSRGRKILRDEVTTLVTGALERSAPGSAFANAVVAAIPLGTGGLAGAGATKTAGMIAGILFPLSSLSGALVGSIAIMRTSSGVEEKRSKMRLLAAMWLAAAALWLAQSLIERCSAGGRMNARVALDAKVVSYFLWAVLVTPLIVLYTRRHIAVERNESKLKLGRKIFGFIGACVMSLSAISWLIQLTWQLRDYTAFYIVSAVGATVVMWCYALFFCPQLFSRLGVAWSFLGWLPTSGVVGAILLLLNWRLDRWIALLRGESLAQAQAFLPLWRVHVATLLLIGWAGAVVMFTKQKSPAPKLNIEYDK